MRSILLKVWFIINAFVLLGIAIEQNYTSYEHECVLNLLYERIFNEKPIA